VFWIYFHLCSALSQQLYNKLNRPKTKRSVDFSYATVSSAEMVTIIKVSHYRSWRWLMGIVSHTPHHRKPSPKPPQKLKRKRIQPKENQPLNANYRDRYKDTKIQMRRYGGATSVCCAYEVATCGNRITGCSSPSLINSPTWSSSHPT